MHAATGKPPPKEKWLIALTVMLATYVAVIDLTIVNVALPQMRGTFGVTLDAVTWVVGRSSRWRRPLCWRSFPRKNTGLLAVRG
jgi:hypothetical protein